MPKHASSPLPWKLKTRRTACTKTSVCEIVDANGSSVIDDTLDDEDGAVYADYKLIVDSVNSIVELK